MSHTPYSSFRDVRRYPTKFLRVLERGVLVPVTYQKSWDDGFGARGWKMDIAIGDPDIIASTRETGERIHTSVFVHDILDHFLSGFGVSGHRSEAMALIQLSKRTGSDPTSDYRQMVEEDILNGRVNGEPFVTFLPKQLRDALPPHSGMTDVELIEFLKQKYDVASLRDLLVKRFFALGERGRDHAVHSWLAVGLRPEKQTEIGLAVQSLLEMIDLWVEDSGIDKLEGFISIDNGCVTFAPQGHGVPSPIDRFQATVS